MPFTSSTAGYWKDKHRSEATKKKIAKSCTGYKHTDEAKEKIRKNHSKFWLGKKRAEATREKLSEASRRRFKRKEDHPMFGKHHTAESNKKNSEAHKRLIRENPEYRYKILNANLPTKSEMRLEKVLNALYPKAYEYVGDGKLYVVGKCPDFISEDNKQIIELFGEYWHKGREEADEKRLEAFRKAGYRTLVIWEKELSDERLLKSKIKEFSNELN